MLLNVSVLTLQMFFEGPKSSGFEIEHPYHTGFFQHIIAMCEM